MIQYMCILCFPARLFGLTVLLIVQVIYHLIRRDGSKFRKHIFVLMGALAALAACAVVDAPTLLYAT
ncbi:hypothetical protein BEN30_08790 [Magnetovibrio blakemorei]|uniref:Uncharacterized protein n=1 Tax=Magnetovibrio blakemorei TaxID=28181 RepID=A0A1E5Q857_9PROT|nr:hypothetical protein BEN30_08790 [Magnetovibrio blakemorei]